MYEQREKIKQEILDMKFPVIEAVDDYSQNFGFEEPLRPQNLPVRRDAL
jgi:hypothetical protein